MNPNHLETLLAVLDEGTFEAAADALGVTPSAVSQRIKTLEAQTGRVLVHRKVPATATEAGEILAQSARKMALLQAETETALKDRMARVPLVVGVNADSLATWFPNVFHQVAAWGNTALRIRIEDESQTLKLLRAGDVLGAITLDPEPVSGCDVCPLGIMRYIPVAAPQLVAKHQLSDGKVNWDTMPTLRFGPNDAMQAAHLQKRSPGQNSKRMMHEIPSAEAFLAAATAGLGWCLLPEQQIEELLAQKQLVPIDELHYDVALYWQRWRLESQVLQDLTTAVVAAAGEQLLPLDTPTEK